MAEVKPEYKAILAPVEEFYKKHQKWILGIGGAVVVVALTTFMYFSRERQTSEQALEKLAMADVYQSRGMYVEAQKTLEEIVNSFPGTKYAGMAMYQKAVVMFSQNDFVTAKDLAQKVLAGGTPKQVLPFSAYLLGQSLQGMQDYKAAIEQFNAFIKANTSHFLTPRAYESLAVSYELIGDLQNAKSTYDQLKILYPGSSWQQSAEDKLAPKAP